MKKFIIFSIFISACLIICASDSSEKDAQSPSLTNNESNLNSKFDKEGNVYVLTDENFESFIQANPTSFIKFYAPWCGHCKKLAPEYETAAKLLDGVISFAKIDCTVHKVVCQQFSIQGYPTLKLFKTGLEKPIDYDGARDSNSLVAFVGEKTDPNYKPPKDEVIDLTGETFDEFIGDKPIVLVEFYAPWCGHCKKLEPEYERAAKRLKPHKISLVKIDATVEKKLSEQYSVEGFPTLKILRYGRRFDYNGPRDAEGIYNYMLDQSKPAATILNSVKEVQKFTVFNDVTIIGFFQSAQGKFFDSFIDSAEKTRNDFVVGYTTDPSVFQHFKAKPNTIVLYQPQIFWSKYEPHSFSFNRQDAPSEEFLAFYREHATPLVGLKTRTNAATRYSKLPLVVVYYNVDFSVQYRDGTQHWRKKILPIANKYKKEKYTFAIADEEEFSQELIEIGLGNSGLEHNVVIFGVNGKKYPMSDEIYDSDLEENLETFLNDISKGKVKPFVKSASPPKSDKGPVKTVVGSTFDKIVNDKTKDVLIEFYAPWCGHCKSFEPKYKQFAAKLNPKEKNLVLAKFDATANDAPPNFKVEGFPTIYFAPANNKENPLKYTGNRDLDDLEKFIKENAVASFKKHDEF